MDDSTILEPSTQAMQAAGRLPSNTFLDIRSAKQGYLKSKKFPRDRRSRGTTRCHCCYDYMRHQVEKVKKVEARIALLQEDWEDDHDVDDDPIPWEFLGYAWDRDLLWDEDGPMLPPWECAVVEQVEGETDVEMDEWDMVSDDASDTWSIISGDV